MPIFDSGPLTAALFLSIVSVVPYYLMSGMPRFQVSDWWHVQVFFWVWLVVYAVEYYILGPFSFVEKTTEGNLNVSFNHYLETGHDGGRFTHVFGGGQDVYTFLFGKHFYNPYRLVAALVPTWLAILSHKLMIGALAFIGAYLLAFRFASGNRLAALSVAAVFPFTHAYLLNFSTNWSPGFSVLPLVAYLVVVRADRSKYWAGILLAALFVTPAGPIHVFPALTVMLAGTVILLHPVNYRRIAGAYGVLLVCSILNWHEVIYAFYQTVGHTSRYVGSDKAAHDLVGAVMESARYLASTMWLPLAILAVALIGLARGRDIFAARAGLVAVLPIACYIFEAAFPWHTVGLAFMNRFSHYYLLISVTGLFIPIAARWLGTIDSDGTVLTATFLGLFPARAVLAVGLAVLTWTKFLNFGMLIWFGGQSQLTGYENLRNNTWKPAEYFRVVTPFEKPNANIIAGFYGLDTFDAQTNMNYSRWAAYWESIVRNDPDHNLTTRIGVKWKFWDGQAYAINDHIDLNLLGVVNVRFLLSGAPLKADGLKLVFQPSEDDQIIRRAGWFPGFGEFLKFRIKRIFDPGKLFIYELPRFLPRVFAAQSVVSVEAGLTPGDLHKRISRTAFGRDVLVTGDDAEKFRGLGQLRVLRYGKVPDGFDVDVAAPEGGVLVVNTPYLPFWAADDGNGRRLPIVPANAIHLAVAVPAGVDRIRVRYDRPLLRHGIITLLSGGAT